MSKPNNNINRDLKRQRFFCLENISEKFLLHCWGDGGCPTSMWGALPVWHALTGQLVQHHSDKAARIWSGGTQVLKNDCCRGSLWMIPYDTLVCFGITFCLTTLDAKARWKLGARAGHSAQLSLGLRLSKMQAQRAELFNRRRVVEVLVLNTWIWFRLGTLKAELQRKTVLLSSLVSNVFWGKLQIDSKAWSCKLGLHGWATSFKFPKNYFQFWNASLHVFGASWSWRGQLERSLGISP